MLVKASLAALVVACMNVVAVTPADAQSVDAGFVIIQGTDSGSPLVISSPNLSCGPYENGSVSCTGAMGRRKCASVTVKASHVPNGFSTVSGTVRCGTLSATATAGPLTPTDVRTARGQGVQPIECSGPTTTGVPILPQVTCSYEDAV